MERMKTPSPGLILVLITTALVLAACASDAGTSSTDAPPTDSVPAAGPRIIEIESDAALRLLQDGVPISDIPVTPGETVLFRVDNTAGFDHNFYIGTDEELSVPSATTEVGIPTWGTGVRELEWTVPEDIGGLKFGCTVPGHYFTQQGTFSIRP
jgi:uncharacterized cupredoxin-like copper-binding protein